MLVIALQKSYAHWTHNAAFVLSAATALIIIPNLCYPTALANKKGQQTLSKKLQRRWRLNWVSTYGLFARLNELTQNYISYIQIKASSSINNWCSLQVPVRSGYHCLQQLKLWYGLSMT